MNGRYLLDTNILIGLINGEAGIESAVLTSKIFIPVVALAELYFGAAHSGRPLANQNIIERLVSGKVVLGCDVAVAREYGTVKGKLRAIGISIPDNDIWIAAIALTHQLLLVTRDKHFLRISDLELVQW